MKQEEILKLIQQFEKDMATGTKSVSVKINDSPATHVMRQISSDVLFPVVARYLKGTETKTKCTILPQVVVDGYIKEGWTLFLYWYKKKWKVNCHLSAQATFEDWYQWLLSYGLPRR